MAIIGIGTDLVKISRVKRIHKKFSKNFAERILHKNEKRIYRDLKVPATYLAKRFAAKEALAKALGTGIANGVTFKEIEVSNDENGQPVLTLHGETLNIAEKKGVKRCFISLTDEDQYAVAYVVLEGDS